LSKRKQQIDLLPFMESTVKRRLIIKGVLKNIHGQHSSRKQDISGFVISEETSDKQEGVDELETKKRVRRKTKQDEAVFTFPKNEKGNLLVPLGGRRGYIRGSLRVAMLDLYKDKLQDRNWEGYGLGTYIDQAIFITPDWTPVGKKFSNRPESPKKYLVQTAGRSRGMMTTYYDYVESSPFEITVEMTNTKIPKNIFLSMLASIQRLGIGPKGRGKIIFTEVVQDKWED